jgi:DNA-binding CsgD family transcriptional regulator
MSYSRETMIAFSDVLEALHSSGKPEAALRIVLPKLGALFDSRQVDCEEVPGDCFPRDDSLYHAECTGDRMGFVFRRTSSVLTITLRREWPFSEDDAQLGALLQEHIVCVLRIKPREANNGPRCTAADFHRLRYRGLTPRECEVVFWIAQGKHDAEIATILGCAPKTVSKHAERVLAKFAAETRLAAAHAAQEWLHHVW